MENLFPIMYSMLSSQALRNFVAENYDIGQISECKLLTRGLNDTYRISTDGGPFILRVYRTPWRKKSDVFYELDVLEYLHRNGASVSTPIRSKSGDAACEIMAPEGTRFITLFTYATGSVPKLTPPISREYGRTVAQIHNLTDHFSSPHARFRLDFRHLLDDPLQVTTPKMVEYGGDIDYVRTWVNRIKESVPVDSLDYGFCHGDFHDWNAHWDEDRGTGDGGGPAGGGKGSTEEGRLAANKGKLTIFDFDCCGRGFRAYDLAVFLWNLKTNYKGKESENWAAFLEGYTGARPLAQVELDVIPFFVAARRIWLAGIYLANEDVWGTAIINAGFFQSFVDQLKEDDCELEKSQECGL